MPSLRIAACQINLVVGDLDGNVDKILAALATAEAAEADIAVFPELAVTGYPPEDLVLKPGFMAANRAALDSVVAATGDTVAVVGFVDGQHAKADPNGRAMNAAAVCANGAVHGVYHKRALPDYGVFDEERYYAPGTDSGELYRIAGATVGVSICEDLWIAGGPVVALARGGAEIIININASPYAQGKRQVREDILAQRSQECGGVPIVYLNLVGGQDELVFDGGSLAVDATGAVVAAAGHCTEEVLIFDIETAPDANPVEYPVVPVTEQREKAAIEQPDLAAAPELLEEVWDALVLGTRDYVHKAGFTDICFGLSGGVDSSIVAAIAADALGPEHVHAVLMPSRFSSDHSVSDSERLSINLGIDYRTIAIEPAHHSFLEMFAPSFGDLEPDVTEENLQSRIRGVTLMALANKFGWLVLTTGNKSELAVGYSTLYGDTAGAFAVIKDVWKLMVYDLCRWRNQKAGMELIPEHVLTKPPSAELRPDQRDDQSLPPYEILDPLLIELVENDKIASEVMASGEYDPEVVKRISRLLDIAEFKRRQNPIGPKVSTKNFGRDRRMPITNKFRGLPRETQ